MANLDERFLDGPNVGYCSDSDEETPTNFTADNADLPPPSEGMGPRTGPKGVINDYRLHHEELRQIEKEKEQFRYLQATRMNVAPTQNTVLDQEEEDDNAEDELQQLRLKRMQKMRQMKHGHIQEVGDKYKFLSIIENAEEDELIFIHIYRDDLESCKMLNDALLVLSCELEGARFYKVKPTILETSDKFERNALPTLQVYLNGQIVANFVRITDDLPDEFDNHHIFQMVSKKGVSLKLKNEA